MIHISERYYDNIASESEYMVKQQNACSTNKNMKIKTDLGMTRA